MLKVTTSWDDGDILDKRLADLLFKYNLQGTFYIAKNFRPERLTEEDIKNLSQKFEVGAHTLSHPDLRELLPEKQEEEIRGSKKWLEKVISKEVKMFCYPKGLYDDGVVKETRLAGFVGARTTGLSYLSFPPDPFCFNTTIQIYPFPLRKLGEKRYYLRKLLEPYAQRAFNLRQLGVPTRAMYSWLSMAQATFDIALGSGQVFHLWGHSWEIEKYGMWEDLEKFFKYISNKKDCEYLTNGELLENKDNNGKS